MTPIEIIAVVLIALGVLKLLFLAVKPRAWAKFADFVYGGGKTTQWIAFVLAVVVLYFLLQELSVVQILATTAFIGTIMAMGFAAYPKDSTEFIQKMLIKKTLLKKTWLPVVIWLVLMAWALKEIFL